MQATEYIPPMGEPEFQPDVEAILDRLNATGCVVTTAFAGRVAGCLVTFITPCSLDPARLLVCTSHENLTYELIEHSGVMAIHPVDREQRSWVDHFGHQSGREVDKFATFAWEAGLTGAPILKDALGYIEGRVIDSIDCGDHTAQLVEPVAGALLDPDAQPLSLFEVFARGVDDPRVPPAGAWTGFSLHR